jgi:hypothetical protein
MCLGCGLTRERFPLCHATARGKQKLIGRCSDFRIFLVALVALAATCGAQLAFALGTPRGTQIGGFIHSSLQTIITGEFAGRRPSQADALPSRAVCRPDDYTDLRAAANDTALLDALRRRCKFVDVKVNDTHVVGTAYLPAGYCETLKRAYDNMLAERVYAVTDDSQKHWVEFEYKGSRYLANDGALVRGAQLQTKCNDDGSLSISAPRKRK